MATIYITPQAGCSSCFGRGEVYDVVDWGSTTARMPSLCDCVLDQIPDGHEDDDVELVTADDPRRVKSAE